MADFQTPEKPSPWRLAFNEARAVALAAVLIAVAFNLLSATRITWVHEARPKGTSVADALGNMDTATAQTAPAPAPIDTVVAMVDTVAVPSADSAMMEKRRLDSIARWQKDSIRQAQLLAQRKKDSAAAVSTPPPANDKQALIDKAAGMSEIQTDLAKALFDKKAALFIDARPEDHYNESHIVGAINCYAEQWQSRIGELIKIPKETMIITYCGGGDECELSHDLADHLRQLGFKRVTVYKGGIKDWTAKGFPLTGAGK